MKKEIDYKEAQDFEKSAFVVSLEEFRKLEKELNDLKKELDNSKFGSQCIIHELEYDKKTLIKENLELKENAERIGVNRYRQLCEAETNIVKLMKFLKSLVCVTEKDEINKNHLDTALRKARNVIADIDPTIEKCDCCY